VKKAQVQSSLWFNQYRTCSLPRPRNAGDGGPLVVVGQTGSLSSNAFKDVIEKAVHDGHCLLAGDSSIRMNLLQHFVDVN